MNFLATGIIFSLALFSTACKQRSFMSKSSSSKESYNKYSIRSTGPKVSILYHYALEKYNMRDYDAEKDVESSTQINVAKEPAQYLDAKFDWGAKRAEPADTNTKSGAGIYTAMDPMCSEAWGSPDYLNEFQWIVQNKTRPNGSILFLLLINPNTEIIKPDDRGGRFANEQGHFHGLPNCRGRSMR